MTAISSKPLLETLSGDRQKIPPVWFMRQAGRHLPEYQLLRKKEPDFIRFCMTPELATEATLQPVTRYGVDAAILFSDILILPHIMGQSVWFEANKGPCLTPLQSDADIEKLATETVPGKLSPVFSTIKGVKKALPEKTALIGFAGAPWTVATYMLEGKSTKNFSVSKKFGLENPDSFQKLINLLCNVTETYLSAQIEAGVDVIQIFDSWAGVLPDTLLKSWVFNPLEKIVQGLKKKHPTVPIILFPRGAGIHHAHIAQHTQADALSIEQTMPPEWIKTHIQPHKIVQGNLDPSYLLAGGNLLRQETDRILSQLADKPFIFNLGHGIDKDTPIAHVEAILSQIRGE